MDLVLLVKQNAQIHGTTANTNVEMIYILTIVLIGHTPTAVAFVTQMFDCAATIPKNAVVDFNNP